MLHPHTLAITIFLFYFSLVQSVCPQNGVYVSTQGSDTTGDGTVNNPFHNITTAYNKIRSSESGTICVESGIYSNFSVIWSDPCNVTIVGVDEMNKPMFTIFDIQISNPGLNLESLFVSMDCFFSLNGTSLTMDDIITPKVQVDIISPNTFLIFSGLNVTENLEINPKLADPQCDVQIKDSILGALRCTASSVLLSECYFSKPVYLNSGITNTYACEFAFIISTGSVLNIQSYNWKIANHKISENLFLNNTLTIVNLDSVVGLQFAPESITVVSFVNNMFTCNMLVVTNQAPSVARVIPSEMNLENWEISGNSMNPNCPYPCQPGYEPIFDGIECASCKPGWINPTGHTSLCTPCPAGTYTFTNINCSTCEPGMHAPGLNNSHCSYCINSTPSQNKTFCVPCPSNTYTNLGICHKCQNNDADKSGCKNCGFFTTTGSDCKELTVSGIVVIVIVVGLVITLSVVFFCVRKRYVYTSIPN